MAYSTDDITATEIADAALDKPLVIGAHAVEGAKDNTGFDVRWHDGAHGIAGTSTDDQNASFPHKRSYDRNHHIITKPTTAAAEHWWLLKSGTSTLLADFDCIMIDGHNLGALSATAVVRIANASDVTNTGQEGIEIATWSPAAATGSNESRLVNLSLGNAETKTITYTGGSATPFLIGETITAAGGMAVRVVNDDQGEASGTIEYIVTGNDLADSTAITGGTSGHTATTDSSPSVVSAATTAAQVYSDVQYLAIRITSGSSQTPEIGDVWLGKRRQMPKEPRLGYNPDFQRSNVAKFVSESMVQTSYVRARGQMVLTASMTTTTVAQATLMTTWFNDTEEGTKPFVWIGKPASAPTAAPVMWLDAAELHGGDYIANSSAGPLRPWTFQMSEQAPFLDREG